MVDPDFQRLGIGRDLVRTMTNEAFRAASDWVHVDYEPEYISFCEHACGFRPTSAGLRSREGEGEGEGGGGGGGGGGTAAASPRDPSGTRNCG